MLNQKGQLIFYVLQTLLKPVTVNSVVTYIADVAELLPHEVKESIEKTLEAGVHYGFLRRANRKYFASDLDFQSRRNQRGQLIWYVLRVIGKPATMDKIVSYITDTTGVSSNDIREPIQETVNCGVRYGFIQCDDSKYFIADLKITTKYENIESEADCANNEGNDKEKIGSLEDQGDKSRRKAAKMKSEERCCSLSVIPRWVQTLKSKTNVHCFE